MTSWDFPVIEMMKTHPDAVLPVRAHEGDAGLDLVAVEDVALPPGDGRLVDTGVAMAIPRGYVGMIADRSSMAKRGVKTAGGIIDAGYRGAVKVILWNLSGGEIRLAKGERIAQLLILPIATPQVAPAESLDATARGAGGFGSTGR